MGQAFELAAEVEGAVGAARRAYADQRGLGAVPRAFAVSAVGTLGFVVVFGAFGLVITPLAVSVETATGSASAPAIS